MKRPSAREVGRHVHWVRPEFVAVVTTSNSGTRLSRNASVPPAVYLRLPRPLASAQTRATLPRHEPPGSPMAIRIVGAVHSCRLSDDPTQRLARWPFGLDEQAFRGDLLRRRHPFHVAVIGNQFLVVAQHRVNHLAPVAWLSFAVFLRD